MSFRSDSEFACVNCHQVFKKARSNAKALLEALETFSHDELKDADLVCEECYQEIMSWARAKGFVSGDQDCGGE